MATSLHNEQRDLSISTQSVEKVVSFFLQALKITTDEIILHLVTKPKIAQIHEIYFKNPLPTDCISFPLDPPETNGTGHAILGEIFICPQVAIEYGERYKIDPYEETTRYLIHGLLHLIGFDDIIPEERKKMKAKEAWCMHLLIKEEMLIHQ